MNVFPGKGEERRVLLEGRVLGGGEGGKTLAPKLTNPR